MAKGVRDTPKTTRAHSKQGVHDTPKTTKAFVMRKKQPRAEQLAEQYVQGNVTAHEVEEVLKHVTVRVNYGRQQVGIGRSMVLGLYAYGAKVGISNATKRMPGLTMLLAKFAQQQCPGFPFTSINVNDNLASKPHCDKHNLGASLIIGLGNYLGGALCYHDEDGIKKHRLDEALAGRPDYPQGMQCPIHSINIKRQFFEFDGNKLHFTEPFRGQRYSLVYFVCDRFSKCDPGLRIDLRKYGFNFLFTNPQLEYMKTRKKMEKRKGCTIQLTLRKVEKLKGYCMRTAMGGGFQLQDRKGFPNGTGFSAVFRTHYKKIAFALTKVPTEVQQAVRADMQLMQTPAQGGQFDSKTRALYMTPLKSLEATLRMHAAS